MAQTIVTQEQFDATVKTVEKKTCFRFSAGTDANSAFMVPVDGKNNVAGDVQEFSWKQLQALAALPDRPSRG